MARRRSLRSKWNIRRTPCSTCASVSTEDRVDHSHDSTQFGASAASASGTAPVVELLDGQRRLGCPIGAMGGCVPKVNIYLPAHLATSVKEAGIPISAVCQAALTEAVIQVGRSCKGVALQDPATPSPQRSPTHWRGHTQADDTATDRRARGRQLG